MNHLLRWLDEHLEEYAASILIVAFSTLMFINVVMRYVFQDAIPWAEEITLLLFVWFVWFAIPYSTQLDNHARVTFLQGFLPARARMALEILLSLVAAVFFFVVAVSAIQYLGHPAVRGKTGLLVAYPMWLFYLPAPIGLALTIYRLLRKLARDAGALLESSSSAQGG